MASLDKKPKPKREKQAPNDEELALTEELFGKAEDKVLGAFGDEADGSDVEAAPWAVDTAPAAKRKRARKAAAWVDEDDAGQEVSLAGSKARLRKLRDSAAPEHATVSGEVFEEKLRVRFAQSQAKHQSSWAQLPEDDEVDEDKAAINALLGSTKPLKRQGGKGPLHPGELDIIRCKDANAVEPSRGVVRSVAFHPRGEILLTAGMDKTVRCRKVATHLRLEA